MDSDQGEPLQHRSFRLTPSAKQPPIPKADPQLISVAAAEARWNWIVAIAVMVIAGTVGLVDFVPFVLATGWKGVLPAGLCCVLLIGFVGVIVAPYLSQVDEVLDDGDSLLVSRAGVQRRLLLSEINSVSLRGNRLWVVVFPEAGHPLGKKFTFMPRCRRKRLIDDTYCHSPLLVVELSDRIRAAKRS